MELDHNFESISPNTTPMSTITSSLEAIPLKNQQEAKLAGEEHILYPVCSRTSNWL